MNRNVFVVLLILGAVLLSFSQDLTLTQASRHHIHLVPYSVDGKLLRDCRLQRVVSRDGSRVISQLNQPTDMRIPNLPEGLYRVTYLCEDRLFFDEHVSIQQDTRIVMLVDRSGGDDFQFRSGYQQGLRLTWPRLEEPQGSRGFVRWVRLSHLIDTESWTRELVDYENDLVFPAKPGMFLLTFPSFGDSVCVGVVEVVSFASRVSVSDQNDCSLNDPDGLRVVGIVRTDRSR